MLGNASPTTVVAGAATLGGAGARAGLAGGIPGLAAGAPGSVLAAEAPPPDLAPPTALPVEFPVAPALTLPDALASAVKALLSPSDGGTATDEPEIEGDVPLVSEPRSEALLTDAGTTLQIPVLVPASV